MENVSIVKIKELDGFEIEHVIIDRGNDEFTSMPKSVYDAQLAAQETINAN